MHRSVTISDTRKTLLESVTYYNKTKSGVDNIDHMARLYTSNEAPRRWPLQVFYNILDIVAINAKIVYNEINDTKISSWKFILQLNQELSNVNATMMVKKLLMKKRSMKKEKDQQKGKFARCDNAKTTV